MSAFRYTVLLTRAEGLAAEFVERLRVRNIGVLHVPLIEIRPPADWGPADAAIEALDGYSGIVFGSAKAVSWFFRRIGERLGALPPLPPLHAVGHKTAEALDAIGLRAAVVPETAGAAALADALGDVSNQLYLQPGSDIMRDEFARAVEARGGTVNAVPVYRTVPPKPARLAHLDRLILEGTIDCIAFFSPSAVRTFAAVVPGFTQATVLVAAIGQTTAAAALGSGLRVDIIAADQNAAAFADSIADRLVSSQHIELDPDQHMDIA